MSWGAQAPCILIVAVWAREMLGAAIAAVAPAAVAAAPVRNLRRVDAASSVLMVVSLLIVEPPLETVRPHLQSSPGAALCSRCPLA